MTEQEGIETIVRQSLRLEKLTGIPAEVTAMQANLESNRLRKSDGNNCFGMKAVGRHTGRQLWRTREWFSTALAARQWADKKPGRELLQKTGNHTIYSDGVTRYEWTVKDWFAKFETLESAFDDYGWLITHSTIYRSAWSAYQQHKDWRRLLSDIAQKYAGASAEVYVRGALARLREMQPLLDKLRKEAVL